MIINDYFNSIFNFAKHDYRANIKMRSIFTIIVFTRAKRLILLFSRS